MEPCQKEACDAFPSSASSAVVPGPFVLMWCSATANVKNSDEDCLVSWVFFPPTWGWLSHGTGF